MSRSVKKLRTRTRWQEMALWVVLVLVSSTPAAAQFAVSGGAFATRGFRGRTPLNVTYTLEMAPSNSMGIVKVNVADTAGLSKVDRKLTVILYTHAYGQASNSLAYRYDLELAEGMPK